MALIDKASLLMVPSTYEAGKLYNVLPSGNRAPDSTDQNSGYDQTRADFDFDRGSNTAATRIGSDGLIKKYRENKFIQSNNFSTGWTLSAASVTGNQSDKDGGTNAWLLTDSATTAEHLIRQTPSFGGLVTISVYAKSNTKNWLWLRGVKSAANVRAWFNLENGTKGTTAGSLIDYKIESIGTEGWYRCSMTLQHDSAFEYYIGVTNADGVAGYAGDGTGSIYIQNAQLESGLVSTDYLDSTSVTGKAGVLVDLPRINYDANGENGSLLLEPSRQQLFNYSEYFGDWSVSAGTLTANSATSPEGVKNAYLFTEDTTTGYHRFAKNSGGSNSTKTFSVFAKWAGGSGRKWLTMDNGPICYFDLENGVKGNVGANCTADIEDYGNGWYRCYFTHTNSITGTLYIGSSNTNGGAGNHLGNGENAFYLYGAQAEDGATYPSSYIPNHGESGGVTRAADVCNNGGSAESINSTEGVLYAEISALSNDLTNRGITISDGSVNNRVTMFFTNVSNAIQVKVVVGGSNSLNSYIAIPNISLHNKFALKYKQNDFSLFVNGFELITDTSGNTFSNGTLTKLAFDRGDGAEDFYGNVKQVAVFNEALTDAELAALTA